MFGLPSTTEVEQVLPKSGFYRNMDLSARTKEQFVSSVDRIVIKNVIRPDTSNLADGKHVHEIFVIVVEAKGDGPVSEVIVRTVLNANSSRMIVVDGSKGTAWVKGPTGLLQIDKIERMRLKGSDLDTVWDSLLAQLALGQDDGREVAERIKRQEAIETLEKQIQQLDAQCRKAKQIARKNALFELMRKAERELDMLRKEAI